MSNDIMLPGTGTGVLSPHVIRLSKTNNDIICFFVSDLLRIYLSVVEVIDRTFIYSELFELLIYLIPGPSNLILKKISLF